MASPLIVVLGCTGVGKSKLAIELAKRFGGEVINADSMQVYDALPIATNRVTEVEADGVPHHLLGFLAPTEVYHAGRFLEDVLPVLDDIWARGKLAIVVGGTHYYIEALIFKTLIGTADPKQLQTAADAAAGTAQGTAHGTGAETTAAPVDGGGSAEAGAGVGTTTNNSGGATAAVAVDASAGHTLHEMLSEVDPTMARRLHPNDTRKIQRCLDLYRTRGVPRSAQLLQDGKDGDVLRFKRPCCCLWVDCDFAVLDPRLDARIVAMLKGGLVEEQQAFLEMLAKEQPPALFKDDPNPSPSTATMLRAGAGAGALTTLPVEDEEEAPAPLAPKGPSRVLDYSKGVLQAIGFKEFAGYFALKLHESSIQGGSKGATAATKMFEECTDKMKRFTRRYARKQVTWIQRRLMEGPPCKQLYLHKFNASNLETWDLNVLQEAVNVVEAQIAETPLPGNDRKLKASKAETLLQWRKYTCDICNGKVLNGDHEWQAHTKSKSHRNRTKKRKNGSGSAGGAGGAGSAVAAGGTVAASAASSTTRPPLNSTASAEE